jgi:hypothetical protein
MLWLVLGNAIPIGALAFFLMESIEQKQKELSQINDLISIPVYDALDRVNSICRASTTALLALDDIIAPVDPHQPESAPLILTKDVVVENVEATIPGVASLFDSISASRDETKRRPLNFIHFGLPADSVAAQRLSSSRDRLVKIVYTGGLKSNDISVSVTGRASFVDDKRLKEYYFRDRWLTWMKRENYVLVKLLVTDVDIYSLSCGSTLADGVKFTAKQDEWGRI